MSRPRPIQRRAANRQPDGAHNSCDKARASSLSQARTVFLGGCGLLDSPPAWAGRRQFVVLETGFGLGTNFLATWQAWLADATRPDTLHVVSLESNPPAAAELIAACTDPALLPLAHELAAAWPPAMRGLHQLAFAGGRVKLTLALGDARELLPQLDLGADAIDLHATSLDGLDADGSSSHHPAPWEPGVIKAVARLARHGARLACCSATPELCAALQQAGFDLRAPPKQDTPSRLDLHAQAEALQAVYAPRWRTRRLEPRAALAATAPRHAMVIGAGLAGAACAQALAVRGWSVDVLDAEGAAAGASALPAGLAHARVSPDDDRLARLGRTGLAALLAAIPERQRAELWHGGGLLLAESESELAALTVIASALALPPEVAEVVDAGCASLRARAQMSQGGWWSAGGVAAASSLVRAWLATPGVRLQGASRVHRVQRTPDAVQRHAPPGACMQAAASTSAATSTDGPCASQAAPRWQALDAAGRVLAQAPVCIVATALDAARLLDASHLNPGGQSLPLRPQAGQAFLVPAASLPQLAGLQRPLVGDAYVLPLPAAALQALPNELDSNDAILAQAPWLLLGATYEDDPAALMPREAAWAHIVAGLAPLVGALPPAPPAAARLFQGVRAVAHDRLPCAGPWPDWTALASAKPGALHRPADELPPLPGLYLSTAMGSRGLTLAALAAACIATHLEGEPAPLERDLLAALAPGRFGLRRAVHEGLG